MRGFAAPIACLGAALACPALAAAAEDDSAEVWGLLKERKYFEAERLIAALPAQPEQAQADAEAVKLLREFWAAVERGVAARKGKFLAIGGAGGNIVAVRHGEVILQAGKAEFKRRLDQLDARHALLHADLKDDARSHLMKAVFLIAEGGDPAEAQKALDAAGNAPFAAHYKHRVAQRRLSSQEAVAQEEWRAIEARAKGRLSQEAAKALLETLDAFSKKHAATKACEALREKLDAVRAAAQHAAEGWVSLYDGQSLDGWKVSEDGLCAKHGKARVEGGKIVLEPGDPLTAIVWTREFPTVNYELRLEATRLDEADFGGIVFPVGASYCLLSLSEWRGTIVGLSCVDGLMADRNPTGKRMQLALNRPYQVRLRVTKDKIEAWIDAEKVVDFATAGRTVAAPADRPTLKPFAIETCWGAGAFRNIMVRRLDTAGEGAERLKAAVLPVPARAEWFDTGLDLTKGQRYTIAAEGDWGPSPTWKVGPEGGAEFLPQALVPGARFVALVARVATQKGFEIGKGRTFVAEASGRLYLSTNDSGNHFHDNWGCVRVTITGPLVADSSAPLLTRARKLLAQLAVSARSDWSPAGVEVKPGERLLITATGTWAIGRAAADRVDPDGHNRAIGRGSPLRFGSLIGRIGEAGAPFNVGSCCLLVPKDAGKLFLSMHDSERADNTGSVQVTIRAFQEP